jgi:hypothetical protein
VNIAVIVSLVLAILAVLGVFIEIPYVSDFAFWIRSAPTSCSRAVIGGDMMS